MNKPYRMTINFTGNAEVYDFYRFFMVLVHECWSAQKSADSDSSDSRWSEEYIRHVRTCGSATHTYFFVRHFKNNKDVVWELEIELLPTETESCKKIEIRTSHESAIKKLRLFIEKVRGKVFMGQINYWASLGKRLTVEENKSGILVNK